MLEFVLTGFRSQSDMPKTTDQFNIEILSNFTDIEQRGSMNFDAQNSFFDSVFVLNTSQDECKRRALDRKMDPTNNAIFHKEDNPPPTND
jgi:hypothetical protein